jgi:hypothetical protein
MTDGCDFPIVHPDYPLCVSRGIKRPEREADHSPPSSADVNAWSCTPFPRTSSWRGA